jgi:hypothetical protein
MSTLRKRAKPSKADQCKHCRAQGINGCCKPCACEPDIVATAPPKRRLTAPPIQIVPLHHSILRSSSSFFSRNLSNYRLRGAIPTIASRLLLAFLARLTVTCHRKLSTPQVHLTIAAQQPRRTRHERPHYEKRTQPHYCRVYDCNFFVRIL